MVGRAVFEGGDTIIRAVVARHPKPDEDGESAVVSPYDGCRELFADHAPDAGIIVPGRDGLAVWSVQDLLLLPYQR